MLKGEMDYLVHRDGAKMRVASLKLKMAELSKEIADDEAELKRKIEDGEIAPKIAKKQEDQISFYGVRLDKLKAKVDKILGKFKDEKNDEEETEEEARDEERMVEQEKGLVEHDMDLLQEMLLEAEQELLDLELQHAIAEELREAQMDGDCIANDEQGHYEFINENAKMMVQQIAAQYSRLGFVCTISEEKGPDGQISYTLEVHPPEHLKEIDPLQMDEQELQAVRDAKDQIEPAQKEEFGPLVDPNNESQLDKLKIQKNMGATKGGVER